MSLKKGSLLFFCVLVIISLLSSCCTVYKKRIADVQKKIMQYNGVESVTVIEDHGIWSLELTLEITFLDGRELIVHSVEKDLSGDLRIEKIGKYNLVIYNRRTNVIYNTITGEFQVSLSGGDSIPVRLIEKHLHIKIANIYDIFNNYDAILIFVETLQPDPMIIIRNPEVWSKIPDSGYIEDEEGAYKLFR